MDLSLREVSPGHWVQPCPCCTDEYEGPRSIDGSHADESQEGGESADSPEDTVERIDPITGVKVSEEDAPTG